MGQLRRRVQDISKRRIDMHHILTISGSPSETSRLAALLDYLHRDLEQQGYTVDWVNVRNLPPIDLLHARFDSPHIQAGRASLARAAAVIVGTPVYKAAYTGLLKAYLDLLPERSLEGKVVLPIATAGTKAHLLSLEYALKPVLSVLGATHILHGVFALESQVVRTMDGTVVLDADIQQRLQDACAELRTVLSGSAVEVETGRWTGTGSGV
jgi:FMN reductase